MNLPQDLRHSRVAIAGLGLMGGSLAMALKGHCAEIDGVDLDPAVVQLALERQVVENASCDPGQILPASDLVILATPVNAIIRLLQDLPQLHPGSPVVLDLGSTKRTIVQVMDELPSRFDPIGGHPMCGKEKTGLANATSDLFQGSAFALTTLTRTSPRAQALAEQVVRVIGARLLCIDADTHDRWTACTSHLPYLLASALAGVTPIVAAPLVGPGFRSTSRLAGTPSGVMLDILMTNKEFVLQALRSFRERLDRMENQMRAGDWMGLEEELDRAAGQFKQLTEPAAWN